MTEPPHSVTTTDNASLFKTSQSRWTALTRRTPSSHSAFIYGVISTKIYCRPTCSARLARRANVVFYDSNEQARRDGFRPCKRCQPDNDAFAGSQVELTTRILALLRSERAAPGMGRDIKTLAQELGVTPSYLCRVFKKTMGITIGKYIREFEKTCDESNSPEIDCCVTPTATPLMSVNDSSTSFSPGLGQTNVGFESLGPLGESSTCAVDSQRCATGYEWQNLDEMLDFDFNVCMLDPGDWPFPYLDTTDPGIFKT